MSSLDELFENEQYIDDDDRYKLKLYKSFNIIRNPFPSASSTTGHPHMPIQQDEEIMSKLKSFIAEGDTKLLVVTGTQGTGKTNLLSAYDDLLTEKMSNKYIIRYLSNPEPTFDPLIKTILTDFGKERIQEIAIKYKKTSNQDEIDNRFSSDVKTLIKNLSKLEGNDLAENCDYAFQWLLGLPVRKVHKENLGIFFRLDTVEAKTRALKDIIEIGVYLESVSGIFLLLDELEKQDGVASPAATVKYLSALRALIDALPKHLFLMLAMTTDAMLRYSEMLPALKGRLATKIELLPIRSHDEAEKLFKFYLNYAEEEAKIFASKKMVQEEFSSHHIISQQEFEEIYEKLSSKTTSEGIRQREFFNALHEKAGKKLSRL